MASASLFLLNDQIRTTTTSHSSATWTHHRSLLLIQCCSRSPEYYFTTREAMQEAVARGEFIESAEFSGNMYGTSKKAIRDISGRHKICILDVERNVS